MSVKISSLNTASTINSGDDINIAGNNPLTFSDWGGGWFMEDGTYIRSLNQKSIWLGDGVLASNGGLSVGYGGTLPTAGYAIIAGKVGIGTASPSNKLVVKGGATYLEFGTGTNYADILAYNRDTSTYKTLTLRGSNITFSPSDIEKMQLTNGGSLLLGDTVVPGETSWKGTAVFGINGTDKVITGYLTSSTNGAIIGGHNSALDAWANLNIAGTNLIFRITQTEMMRLNSGGDLLVGTPTSIWGTANRGIIQLNGASQALIGLSIGGASKAYLFHQGTNLSVWNEANGKIEFGTNNTLRLTIAADGLATFSNQLEFSTQGSKIVFGDSTVSSPMMIGEGLVNTFGTDSDFMTIYARSSLRIFSTGINERARFDLNGLRVYGAIVKDGGTSSQFLKADGSVDSSAYISTLATITGNIDSDYGECFVTFDPIPSGTPPLASPNIRTINVGNSYSRRTQLAFDYASDKAYFRRRTEVGWFTWREFIHSGNIGSQSVAYATTAGALTSMLISQFTNNSGYITSSALADYLPLAGGTITGDLIVNNKVYVGTHGCYFQEVLIGGVYELQVVDSAGNRTVLS